MESLVQVIDNFQNSGFSKNMRMKLSGLLTILVLAIYGNTGFNGYSVDDNLIVDGNEQAEAGFESIGEILTTNYFSRGEKKGSYRAIPRATYAVEIGVFGKRPGVSHVINVFLFLFSCLLVLKLLTQLFPRGHSVAILFAVVLFAVHPIHTEVVASLKNRDELMQLLFSLLSAISLVHFARIGKVIFVLLSSMSFLIALACKESAIQFLALFPVIFYYAGNVRKKEAIIAVTAFIGVAIGFGGFQVFVLNPDAVLWMDAAKEEFPFIEHPLMHTSELSLKLGTAFYGLGYYFKLFLAPYPLGFFYGYNQIEIVSIFSPAAIGSVLLYGTLLLVGLKGLKSRSFLSLGIIIMLVCLSIFSNLIVQVSGIIAERFAYSSSLGFCIMAGWIFQAGLLRLKPSGRVGLIVLSTLLIGLFAGLTIERNTHWKSYLTLATHDANVFKESAITHFYLGLYVENEVLDTAIINREDWWRKAAFEYSEVSRIHPASIKASIYAANIYKDELNNVDSAIIMYEKLFDNSSAHKHLYELRSYGFCLKDKGRNTAAIEVFKECVQHHPSDLLSHQYLAEMLFTSNETADLLLLLDQMELQFPQNDLPSIYRGNVALKNGDTLNAIAHFENALLLNSKNEMLINFLQSIYEQNGMKDKAQTLRSRLANPTN